MRAGVAGTPAGRTGLAPAPARAAIAARGESGPRLNTPATAVPAFGYHASVAGDGDGVLTAVSCATPEFCVAIDNDDSELRFSGRSWSAPQLVEPDRSDIGLTSISCPTASFCVAVDQGGAAVSFNGHRWSKPVIIDNAYISPGQFAHLPLTSVSCASPHFCVATDEGSPLTHNGDFVMFNGTDPSAAVTVPGVRGLTSVSCVSATFCLAISPGPPNYYQTWRTGHWTAPRKFLSSYVWNSVSCVTSSYCVSSNFMGYVTTFNGRTWSRPRLVDPSITAGDDAVSCASRRACMVVAGLSAAWWNGRRWGPAKRLDSLQSSGLDAVSCATSRFCAAVDAGNPEVNPSEHDSYSTFASAATFNGREWTRLRAVDRSAYVTAMSCSSPAFCALITAGGLTATFDGKAWKRSSVLAAPRGYPAHWLSCPSAGFCMATDDLGNAYELKDGRWSRPVRVITPRLSLLYGFPVSCPARDRCVAVGNGQAVTFNGSRWLRPRGVRGVGILGFTAISCSSAQRCVAVTAAGQAVRLRGQTWSRPATISADSLLVTVSCASSDFCLASDDSGSSWRFSGTKWVTLTSENTPGVGQFSCSAVGFCGANAFSTGVDFYVDGRWIFRSSGLAAVEGYITAVSCFRTTFCAVTDTGGDAFWG